MHISFPRYTHCFSLLPCIRLWIVPRFMSRSKYHKGIFPSRHTAWARFGCCLCRPLSLWTEMWKATEEKGITGKPKWCKLATVLTPSCHPQRISSGTPAVLAGGGGAAPHKCTMVGSPLKNKTEAHRRSQIVRVGFGKKLLQSSARYVVKIGHLLFHTFTGRNDSSLRNLQRNVLHYSHAQKWILGARIQSQGCSHSQILIYKCGTDIFIEEKFGATARVKKDDQTGIELHPSLNAEKSELRLWNVHIL